MRRLVGADGLSFGECALLRVERLAFAELTRDVTPAAAHTLSTDEVLCPALAEPTFFQNRKREKTHHIDHVFVPAEWIPDLRMTIGDYDTWVATGRSDHVPLVVDVSLP